MNSSDSLPDSINASLTRSVSTPVANSVPTTPQKTNLYTSEEEDSEVIPLPNSKSLPTSPDEKYIQKSVSEASNTSKTTKGGYRSQREKKKTLRGSGVGNESTNSVGTTRFSSLMSIPSNLIQDIIGKESIDENGSTSTTKRESMKESGKDCQLFIKVLEAKNIPGKKLRDKDKKRNTSVIKKISSSIMEVSSPNLMFVDKVLADPYCTVSIEGSKFKTRTINQKTNPFWCEEFQVDILNPSGSVIKVYVIDSNKYDVDEIVGKVFIPIRYLKGQGEVEQWFPLFPSNIRNNILINPAELKDGVKGYRSRFSEEQQKELFTPGTVRLKMRYTEERILPIDKYAGLLELLEGDDLSIVKLLGKTTTERETVALILIKIFHAQGKLKDFLKNLISYEIQSTSNPDIIFRGNSLVTKAIDVWMKFVGMNYLNKTMKDIIQKIFFSQKSCEVDPFKLTKPQEAKKNAKRLLKWVNLCWSAIYNSLPNCPIEFHEIFSHVQTAVKENYQPEQVVITKYTAVSGFVFLRFFCPAVLGPKLFGLSDQHPDVTTNRTLILIAKVLQNMANLVEFTGGSKEEYMADMNQFVVDNMDNMKSFLDQVANADLTAKEGATPSSVAEVRLEKELASIYRHLVKNRTEMHDTANDNEKEILQKLDSVLDYLNSIHLDSSPDNVIV